MAPVETSVEAGSTGPETNVLLVDESAACLLSYQTMLVGLGLGCVHARSRSEALSRLTAQEFALVLVNAAIRGRDGSEVAGQICSQARARGIPVILVIGANSTQRDLPGGSDGAPVEYITAPVEPEVLRRRVSILVELHRRGDEVRRLQCALQEARDRLARQETQPVSQNEAQLRAVFEHPTEITVVLEAERDSRGVIRDWIFRDANTNAVTNLGMTREEFIGLRQSQILGEGAEEAGALCERVLVSGEPAHCESRLGDRDFLITVYRIGPNRVVSSSLDITDRKRMERELREGEDRFRELANNIDQFAWTCDQLGLATWYNDRWYEYTGLTLAESQGEGWKRLVDPEHLERVEAATRRSVESGQPWDETFPVRGKDGRYRWFLSRATPIRDSKGNVIRWFGTNTDITEQRRLEEALKDADRRKDEFLAILAHELRNPVAPIRTAAEVLLHLIADDEQQRKLLGMIKRQCTQLARLLEDLLDVARITQGRIALQRDMVSVGACLDEALEAAEPLFREKEHRVKLSRPSSAFEVYGDKARLIQCVANLLTNAARYTDPGGEIRVTACVEEGDAVISVSDTGVGISADLLPRVFEPFVQSDRPLDRSQGGLGLGLSICRRLVEMHGGSISATSEGLDCGAVFTIRLPLAEGSGAAIPATESGARRSRLLIVDDNCDAADSLGMLLQLNGYHTSVAYCAEEALARVKEFEPEIAVLDLGLPRIDGYELGKSIRAIAESTRLVALSGYGQLADTQRSRAAGFDAHLVKPVDLQALEETFRRISI